MDVATWDELAKRGYNPATVCDTCGHNNHIDGGAAYVQGPCGQQHCWLTLEVGEDDD